MLNVSASKAHMSYKRERIATTPEADVELTLHRRQSNETLTVPAHQWPVSHLYERASKSELGPISRWKSFAHYKRAEMERVDRRGTSVVVVGTTGFSGEPVYSGVVAPDQIQHFGFAGDEDDTFGSPGIPLKGLPSFIDSEKSGLEFIPDPEDLQKWLDVAYRHMLPTMRAQLSLLNSVLELKDFKSLGRTLSNLKGLVTAFRNSSVGQLTLAKAVKRAEGTSVLRRIHETYRRRAPIGGTAMRGVRVAADAYLQEEFNISPLISDIAGIHKALSRFERKINNLVSRAGQTRTFHYQMDWHEFSPAHVVEERYVDGSSWVELQNNLPFGRYIDYTAAWRHVREVSYEKTSFRAHMRCNYCYNAYQVEHARLLALLDSLGVSVDPAIIWNAIPWTFVVDWVLGVSSFLKTLRVGFMDPKINILQGCWSVKRHRKVEMRSFSDFSLPDPWFEHNSSCVTQPTVEETAYKRVVYMPTASSLSASGLNLKEFSLGAALIIAQGRRYKRLRAR